MSEFHQFDISSFLDEIQDPLFLISRQEIIYWNRHYKANFDCSNDNWREFFKDNDQLRSLDVFFEGGQTPQEHYFKSIIDKEGVGQRFEWVFINLPSSYHEKFLIVKGNRMTSFSDKLSNNVMIDPEGLFSDELRYMQSILNNSHDLICILDEAGNYKFISTSVSEKLGFSVDEIIGKNYRDFAKRGMIEIVKGSFEEVLYTDKEVNIDLWTRKKDGTKIYLESFARNFLNHQSIGGILFSARDITEYIEIDKSLQRRLEIENLINRISSQLINSRQLDIANLFNDSLTRFSEFLNADCSWVFIQNRENGNLEQLSEWFSEKDTVGLHVDLSQLIRSEKEALKEGVVRFLQLDERGVLLIPMVSAAKLSGLVAVVVAKVSWQFKERELPVFRQLGDILVGAYMGSQLLRKIERNESLLANAEILSKSGSWRYSTSKNIFFMSGGLSYMFGFGNQPVTAEFTSLLYKIQKVDRHGFVQNLKKSIETIAQTSGEFTVVNGDGSVALISYEIEAKKDFLSQGLEVVGFCTDISHKRASQEYLKLQSQILAQVSDPIIVTNLDLDVIYMNEAVAGICGEESAGGYSGQIQGLLYFNLSEDKSLKEIVSGLEAGKQWKKICFIETWQASASPFEISVQKIHSDQDEIGYSFILRSLAEKYESERIAKQAQMIVENSPAVLFRVLPDEDFRIQYISENIRQFGYESQDLINGGVSFFDILHPDDAKVISSDARKSKGNSGTPSFSGEYRIRKKDGTFAWVEDRTRDVLNSNGEIVIHEGLFQEITDRKNLELFNKEKDRQYRVLASNIPGTNIFLMDRDRRYILAEGTNFEYWQLSRNDFEGKQLSEISISNYEEVTRVLDRVFEDREIVESEFFFKNRCYHRIIRPIIENDEVEYALSIVRDINEEHQAKVNLLKSEEKYRTLVEESTEIIFSLSDTFELQYVSPNVNQFLGYTTDEVIGHSIFEFLNSEDMDIFHSKLVNAVDFLAENQFLEFRLRHKSGEYKVFNTNGRMVEDKNDNQRYYTGIARDISKLKEAQRELLMAKDKAEQASQVKSQFLSVISHEIRTPMNAVIGLSHFLMEENPRPDQLENLKTLQFSAENLMGLINDILDFNKIDSGKIELEHIPFNIRNVINRIVHSHSFHAGEKGIAITCEIDPEVPRELLGDPIKLGQIVNNLVSNSIKFTEKGNVKIELKYVDHSSKDIGIKFVVTDTGIGIPPEKQKIIFEAFTQASTDTTRKYGGSGLGLAIVKRLVELLGSTIKVDSVLNVGSVFDFTLRFELMKETNDKKSQGNSNPQKSLHEANILVAEDNTVNQILIRKFLTKWNTGNLVIASDGEEALREFDKGDFNIVLLDLQMPLLDGFAVAKAIRENPDPVKGEVPILVLTASSLHEIKDEMQKVGIDDFVPKPFAPDDLYSKLFRHLDSKDTL